MATGLLATPMFWDGILSRVIGKQEVQNLLLSIAGGEQPLTLQQLHRNRDVILSSVASMRAMFEQYEMDHPLRSYYQTDWTNIQFAVELKNDQMLVDALIDLRDRIKME